MATASVDADVANKFLNFSFCGKKSLYLPQIMRRIADLFTAKTENGTRRPHCIRQRKIRHHRGVQMERTPWAVGALPSRQQKKRRRPDASVGHRNRHRNPKMRPPLRQDGRPSAQPSFHHQPHTRKRRRLGRHRLQ